MIAQAHVVALEGVDHDGVLIVIVHRDLGHVNAGSGRGGEPVPGRPDLLQGIALLVEAPWVPRTAASAEAA